MMHPPAHGVETFHAGAHPGLRTTLVDGRVSQLAVPLDLLDPARSDELAGALVDLFAEAFDKHSLDLLTAVDPGDSTDDDILDFVEVRLAAAMETIQASEALGREYADALGAGGATMTGRSDDGEVEARVTDGRLTGLEFGHRLLSSGRVDPFARAVIQAVEAALQPAPVAPEMQARLADLTEADVDADLHLVRQRMRDLGRETA